MCLSFELHCVFCLALVFPRAFLFGGNVPASPQESPKVHGYWYNNLTLLLIALAFFLTEYFFDENNETIKDLKINQSELLIKVATLTAVIEQLTETVKVAASDRYPGSLAQRDNALQHHKTDALEKRVSKLEAKVDAQR